MNLNLHKHRATVMPLPIVIQKLFEQRESNSNVIISVLSHKGGNIRPHKYFYLFESEGATVILVNDE